MNRRSVGLLVMMLLGSDVFAALQLACPSGWTETRRGQGVLLCQKSAFFVTWVDLSSGARIRNMYQFSAGAGSSTNPNPTFVGRTIVEWWTWASSGNVANKPNNPLFSVTNGAFFAIPTPLDYFGTPTNHRFAYPFKDRGNLRTVGSDDGANDQMRDFRMNDADASIATYATKPTGWTNVYNSLGSFTSVVGLYPDATDPARIGRTYLGLRDNTGDGKFESVYIFSSGSATQAEAYNSLAQDFKTVVNIQFDGSDSAQMVTRGQAYVTRDRNFPHGFAIYEAPVLIATEPQLLWRLARLQSRNPTRRDRRRRLAEDDRIGRPSRDPQAQETDARSW